LRRREPTLLAIFAAKGPAGIEFRCGDAVMTEIIPTEPGIWGMSVKT
jgi:hypothetical protein